MCLEDLAGLVEAESDPYLHSELCFHISRCQEDKQSTEKLTLKMGSNISHNQHGGEFSGKDNSICKSGSRILCIRIKNIVFNTCGNLVDELASLLR